jgi:hypothetical protein
VRIATFAAAALAVLAMTSVGRCDQPAGIKFSAREISNVWRFCSISGRGTAAILDCFRTETNKLAQAKDIERNNRDMEAITRQQVGEPAQPAQ